MKKIFVLMLAFFMLFIITACAITNRDQNSTTSNDTAKEIENSDTVDPSDETETNEEENNEPETVSTIEPQIESGTMGEALWNVFRSTLMDNPEIGMEELANILLTDPAIQFSGMVSSVTVDNEYFVGFGEYKITDFETAYSFSPMFGSMAFVGYVFDVEDDTDICAFVKSLEEHCDPCWNICVTAEQTVVGAVGDKVFFVMCPKEDKTKAADPSAETDTSEGENSEPNPINHFEDALFIGDSRTVGIQEYGDINEATFFARVGMSVYDVRQIEVQDIFLQDLLAEKTFEEIYVMLGINELGCDLEYTVSEYTELIRWLRESQPGATIYIQANLHVTAARSDRDPIYNNEKIDIFNARIAELADNEQVFYLDVNPLFDDSNGNLAEDYADGDAHILSNYYLTWTDWLAKM